MYTLTYLETASNFANLLDAIVKYERERLMAMAETSMRKQESARADRSQVSAYTNDLTSTFNTLLMHYERYAGDDAVYSRYLGLTQVAVQSSLSAMAMVRNIAASEADLALWWSYNDELDADVMAEQRTLASDLRSLDFFLYGEACELNETTLVQTPNIIN